MRYSLRNTALLHVFESMNIIPPRSLLKSVLIGICLIKTVTSHGVEVRECITDRGNLRIFVEHWHGDLSNPGQAGTMQIRDDTEGIGEVQTLLPIGLANNIGNSETDLPGCVGTSELVTTCNDAQRDWVYYDFPTQCNKTVLYTFLQGNTVYLTESCGQLYPAEISASFTDSSDPIPLINGEVCDGENIVYANIVEEVDTHALVLYNISAYDDCDRNATVEASTPSGTCFPIGDTNVTLIATDSAGFEGNCTFIVRVLNETASPVSSPTQSPLQIVCPSQSPSLVPTLSPSSPPSRSPSLNPTTSPSNEPSSVPSVAPSLSQSPTVYDVSAPICINISEETNFTSFRGIVLDTGEDANENGILDVGEDFNSNGELDPDSGISIIKLQPNAMNLQLEYTFETGDESVIIDANRINETMPASGFIEVMDGSGKSCTFNVSLDPFDQILFDEEVAFPAMIYKQLFGNESHEDMPLYSAMSLSEVIGNYTGSTSDDLVFSIQITEILVPSSNLTDDTLSDPEISEEIIDFLQEDGYLAFVFGGVFEKDDNVAQVIALAYTYSEKSPEYFVVAIADYSDLFEEDIELQQGRSKSKLFRGLNSRDVQRRGGGCSSGLDRIKCKPGETREVDSACVSAARFAFDQAVAAAQKDYDNAIEVAKVIKAAAMAAWQVKKARDFAKQLIPCVLIGILSGPLGYALCAARALAIVIAKMLVIKLAIEAAFELAKRNALLILEAAIAAACRIFQGAVLACVSCDKKPCDQNSECNSEEYPDPHFRTWNGQRYDFHGECDMIHVSNNHLDLHIRTQSRGRWSAVVATALRFDSDVLEVFENKTVAVNGNQLLSSSYTLDDMYPVEVTSSNAKVVMSGGQYIDIRMFYNSLLVRIDAHGSDFYESKGMTGTWNKYGLIGRDGNTSFTDTTLFAAEWEVNATIGDPLLFSTPAVDNCIKVVPTPPPPTEEEVERANEICDGAVAEGENGREECVFDAIQTGFDEEVIENPALQEPLESIERCVATPEEDVIAAGGLSCAELGGNCVYRCDSAEFDCIGDALCVEAIELTVVDATRRGRRRLEFIEGCSCALPKMPSEVPSSMPSKLPVASPSLIPSSIPSLLPTGTSESPSSAPSSVPSMTPSPMPTKMPSGIPSYPSLIPSTIPTALPPSDSPMHMISPTNSPSMLLSVSPTESPTIDQDKAWKCNGCQWMQSKGKAIQSGEDRCNIKMNLKVKSADGKCFEENGTCEERTCMYRYLVNYSIKPQCVKQESCFLIVSDAYTSGAEPKPPIVNEIKKKKGVVKNKWSRVECRCKTNTKLFKLQCETTTGFFISSQSIQFQYTCSECDMMWLPDEL